MIKNKFITLALVALSIGLFATPSVSFAQVNDDNTPGSFLVFPKFDIRGDTSTQLRIVNNGENLPNNTGDIVDLKVKLNYVCPGIKHLNEFCASLDRTVTFTPYQTRVIDVSDQNPPCNQGYVIAYVLSPTTLGRPTSYNYLTGSYHVTTGRSNEADTAIAIQSPAAAGVVLGTGTPLQLRFGADYNSVGTLSYTDFRASSAVAGSILNLVTLDVLAGMQNPAAVVFIDFWNSAEVPFSTSHEFICWTEKQLETIDLNFLEDNLGTTYGSMRITPTANCPLPGGCPPLIPYDATVLGALTEYRDGDSTGRALFHDQLPKNTVYQPR